MADLSSLRVLVTADTRDFSRKMTGAQRTMSSLAASATRLAGTFGVAFGAYGIARYIKSSVAAFAEQEKAVEGLRATLELTGRAGGGALDRLTEKAAALQRVTTAADEELIGATASLGQLAKELDTGELERAQEAIIGIADVFLKGDVNNAAILLGKTLGSTTNALTRYGIQVDSTASQSEKLRQVLAQSQIFFDASKAKALTLSGRLEQLGNAWGDLKEQVGDVVAQLAGFGPNADAAKGTIVRLTDAIRDNKEELVAWGKAAASILTDILKIGAGILALKTAIGVTRGLGIALGAIGIAAGTIPVAITALLAVLGGGVALFATFKDRVDKARASLQEFRREADRKIAFRVGLPEGRDTLIALRDATSRELERVQQDLERFRQRLGDETFNVAINADVDGPFAEVRKLADEALALQRRLVEVGLAIREWKPAAEAGVGGASDAMDEFNRRLEEIRRGTRSLAQIQRELPTQLAQAVTQAELASTDPFAGLRARIDTLKAALDDAFVVDPFAVTATTQQIGAELQRLKTLLEELSGKTYPIDFGGDLGALDSATDSIQARLDTFAKSLPQQFYGVGVDLVRGIGRGMEDTAEMVRDIMLSIISSLISIATGGLKIFSPSRVSMGWGENLVKGLVLGIEGQRGALEQSWRSVLGTVTQPGDLQPIRQRVEYVREAIPPAPSFDVLVQQIELMRGAVPAAPDLAPVTQTIEQEIAYLRAPVPAPPRLDALLQAIGYERADLPAAPVLEPLVRQIAYEQGTVPAPPTFDALVQAIEYVRGSLPPVGDLVPLTQAIRYELADLPQLPALKPITQTIDLAYGQVPALPDLLQPQPALPPVAATAAPISPQIVVDMTGVTLFGDPAAEARKVGSQVFLREGYTIAKEGGFRG